MATQTENNTVWAFGWSVAIVGVLSSLLVILKEKSEATMAFMKAATGHHWITQGVIVLVLFVVVGFVLTKVNQKNGNLNALAITIVVATILSGLILAGFFLFG